MKNDNIFSLGRPKFSQLLAISIVAIFSSSPVLAGVRAAAPEVASTFINPEPIGPVFAAGGIYGIAGGVLFHGRATFYLETGEQPLAPIPAMAVSLVSSGNGPVSIGYQGTLYRFDVHTALACPLGKFTARDGQIVYSKPPFGESERTKIAGLVKIVNDPTDLIAKEFSGSRFVRLLQASDYSENLTQLSPSLTKRLLQSAGNESGTSEYRGNANSWLNMDMQVTYKVFLMDKTKSVDVSGVPLRYFWKLGGSRNSLPENRPAAVINVMAYSQEFPSGRNLTDFSGPDGINAIPKHYDVVSLFQTAAVFRQIHLVNKTGFKKFVDTTCSQLGTP